MCNIKGIGRQCSRKKRSDIGLYFKTFIQISVSLWCVGRRTMRKMMQAAEKAGMTDKGDYAFFYIDMYNTNSSYYWTDNDDHIEFDSGNQDDEDRSSQLSFV